MKSYKAVGLAVAILAVAVLSGCATKQVKRIETDKVIDLSGRWNDTDSRLVAEEMVGDALSRPWIGNFQQKNHKYYHY